MQKLTVRIEKISGEEIVHLTGPVDEVAGVTLMQLYSQVGKRVVFNFRNVTHFNSNGLRAWVVFLRDFKNDRVIELDECMPQTVQQMNMLPSFRQKAKVRSIYVPFVCPACKVVSHVLLKSNELPGDVDELKPGRCKKCMTPLELDVDDGYLDFRRGEAS